MGGGVTNDITTSNQSVTKIEHKIRLRENADAERCSSNAKYSKYLGIRRMKSMIMHNTIPVSYTHLTLPTILRV